MSPKIRTQVSDFTPGTTLRTILLTKQKRAPTTRNGKLYLAMLLGDRSGELQARLWDRAERYQELFDVGDFIQVDAVVETYNGMPQLKVTHIERVAPDEVDPADFQRSAPRDSQWMRDELLDLVEQEVTRPNIKRLLDALLSDQQIGELLLRAPAAKINHHAYIAGLLQHTLSMCRLALSIGQHYETEYPGVLDTSFLMAGTILHDIGKCWELSTDRVIDYSHTGRLVGHMAIGVELVSELIRQLEIDDDDMELRLKHMILSHHGQLDYGSPIIPQTAEAQILHYIDQIDARMNMFSEAVEKSDKPWSDFHRPLSRFVFGADTVATSPTGGSKEATALDSDDNDQDSNTKKTDRTLDLFQKQ